MTGLLVAGAAPLGRAAREQLTTTEQTATRLRTEGSAARVASAEAARRARSAAASLVTLAAKVQTAERRLSSAQRQLALVERAQAARRARLAAQQENAVRTVAVIQTMARRPPVLAFVQPGSASDVAHTRMALDAMLPDLKARTAGLRAEMQAADADRARLLTAQQRAAAEGTELAKIRAELARAESSARRDAVDLSAKAIADRRRAEQLAVEAVSLRQLVSRLSSDARAAAPPLLRDPVAGTLVEEEGMQPNGVTLAALPQAQVTAPAPGRIAFAGAFRSYGGVIIVDHGGGWRTILSGLGSVSARVGQIVAEGAPLGRMPAGSPRLQLELRNRGGAVDPLAYMAACRGAPPFAHRPGRAMQGEASRIEDRCRVSS